METFEENVGRKDDLCIFSCKVVAHSCRERSHRRPSVANLIMMQPVQLQGVRGHLPGARRVAGWTVVRPARSPTRNASLAQNKGSTRNAHNKKTRETTKQTCEVLLKHICPSSFEQLFSRSRHAQALRSWLCNELYT